MKHGTRVEPRVTCKIAFDGSRITVARSEFWTFKPSVWQLRMLKEFALLCETTVDKIIDNAGYTESSTIENGDIDFSDAIGAAANEFDDWHGQWKHKPPNKVMTAAMLLEFGCAHIKRDGFWLTQEMPLPATREQFMAEYIKICTGEHYSGGKWYPGSDGVIKESEVDPNYILLAKFALAHDPIRMRAPLKKL